MAVWSSVFKKINVSQPIFKHVFSKSPITTPIKGAIVQQLRHSGDHGPQTFQIRASDWQWDKFKDLLHFYLLVGAIPVTGILIYTNIFIGPATLAPIPDGYEPKHWEYHSHPITRFLAHYIVRNPQQEYEKMCHELYEESEKVKLRQLEKDIRAKMADRQDYQAWYYRPAMVKYVRQSKKFFEEQPLREGN